MSNAYVIGHITVKNETKWEEYRRGVAATLIPFGAEVVFRGKLTGIISGEHPHTDTVVLRFPDRDSVDAWYASKPYQDLLPIRQVAADVALLVFEE